MRVLFLTHRLPFAPDRGDRVRAYHILEHLRSYADVELISFAHSADEAARAGDLARVADHVDVVPLPRARNYLRGGIRLPGATPLTHVLLDAPAIGPKLAAAAGRRPDVVLAYCSGMARFAMEPPLASVPCVIDLVDVDSAKWEALAARGGPPLRWVYAREARLLSRFEAAAAAHARATLVVNEREREVLLRIAPAARVTVVPNGVDLDTFAPAQPPAAGRDVVFCGVMDYPPNEEGAIWMAQQVWPAVRRRYADARLRIVGANPTPRVRALTDAASGVEVTGYVADVRPYLWSGAVSVAPLHTARGVQNKVLEALAAGLPAVITSAAAGGLPPHVRQACAVADDAPSFAAAVIEHLDLDPQARRARAGSADLRALRWQQQLAPLRDVLEGACQNPTRR